MKHIKAYKLFESSGPVEIKQYLEDIFQELKDIGFSFGFKIDINTGYGFSIKVDISKSRSHEFGKFKYIDVSDYIESACDYMESIGYYVENFSWYGEGRYKDFAQEEIKYLSKSKMIDFDNMEWISLKFQIKTK